VLNAYFAAGAISAISEDCHNQRITACPCSIEGLPRITDAEGNIIFENCRADYRYAAMFYDKFVADQNPANFEGRVDKHNINIGKQVR
jgi:hypothetical protein